MIYLTLAFIAGVILTCAVFLPIMRYRKKQISELENQTSASIKNSNDFNFKLARLAESVRESADGLTGRDSGFGMEIGSIERIESSIDENAHIVTDIAEKTSSVSTIASKMEEDVLRGFSVLEKNVKKMGDIKDKNSGIINGIISLGNKVNKIRDIVRVINTITDQTKVIAFNAALEAASAGETGKRFAVVAGEVNRLADDIAVLTRQIREQVEEIQSSSSTLIIYSEEGSDRISEGYKLIKDLEDIFREIKSGAEITSNQARIITVSTRQQLAYNEQIHTAVSGVSQEVRQLIGAAEAASVRAGVLNERTCKLEEMLSAEELKQNGN